MDRMAPLAHIMKNSSSVLEKKNGAAFFICVVLGSEYADKILICFSSCFDRSY